jgi:hypothetical protein
MAVFERFLAFMPLSFFWHMVLILARADIGDPTLKEPIREESAHEHVA